MEVQGNYIGPYWSDGKWQESVAWGSSDPKDELDYLARLHDTAYATYKDEKHREAADLIFNEKAQALAKKFPSLAGNLVQYGNYTERALKRTAGNVASGFKLGGPIGALGGLVYTGVQNIVNSNKMLSGTYRDWETDRKSTRLNSSH